MLTYFVANHRDYFEGGYKMAILVKVFKVGPKEIGEDEEKAGRSLDYDEVLEKRVNLWLTSSDGPENIMHTSQSETDATITLVIIYTRNN